MAFPVMAAVAGGTSLLNALLSRNASKQQIALQQAQLNEARRVAMEQERLAKSSRTDAYGNTTRYEEGRGFVTDTTPLTAALLNAQQKEQLAQFREDAPRQRQAAERMDKRSRQADEYYNELFNKNRYARKKSRQEYEAEAIREALASRGKGNNSTKGLMRAALRQGNGQLANELVQQIRGGGTSDLASVIANAKKAGGQSYYTERNADTALANSEMAPLLSTANGTTGANLNFNNQAGALSSAANGALSALLSAKSSGSNGITTAMRGLTAGKATQIPDMSPLVSALLEYTNSPKEEKSSNGFTTPDFGAGFGLSKRRF